MTFQTNKLLKIIVFFGIFAFSQTAFSHHSFATHFDPSKTMEISGTVTEFSFRSPHSFVFVDAANDAGETVNWEVELHSRPTLMRRGLKQELLEPGSPIKIVAWPNRTPNNPLVFGIGIITSDGARIGEFQPVEYANSEFVDSSGVAQLQGRWEVDFMPPKGPSPFVLSETGKTAVENYDAQKSPANTCEIVSIPTAFHLPYIYDIRIDEKEVVIFYEIINDKRVIPIGDEFAQSESTGKFGSSRARIEGDELIIESQDFPASGWGLAQAGEPNGAGADVPSSTEKKLIERYSVSDDGLTININYELADPVFLAETFVSSATAHRASDNEPIYEYICEVDSASRFSQDPD